MKKERKDLFSRFSLESIIFLFIFWCRTRYNRLFELPKVISRCGASIHSKNMNICHNQGKKSEKIYFRDFRLNLSFSCSFSGVEHGTIGCLSFQKLFRAVERQFTRKTWIYAIIKEKRAKRSISEIFAWIYHFLVHFLV